MQQCGFKTLPTDEGFQAIPTILGALKAYACLHINECTWSCYSREMLPYS